MSAGYDYYKMDYTVTRADGKQLTDTDVQLLDNEMWEMMVNWMEDNGLYMNGGTSPLTEEEMEDIHAE